jgi:hypothetical protein
MIHRCNVKDIRGSPIIGGTTPTILLLNGTPITVCTSIRSNYYGSVAHSFVKKFTTEHQICGSFGTCVCGEPNLTLPSEMQTFVPGSSKHEVLDGQNLSYMYCYSRPNVSMTTEKVHSTRAITVFE